MPPPGVRLARILPPAARRRAAARNRWAARMLAVGARRCGGGAGCRMGARSAAAACCALALLLLGGCHSGPDRRFAAEPVSVADVVERVSAPGSVQAAAQADVKAPADARVDRLLVPDGAKVTAGQVLAQLASTQVDDSLRQAQAAADAADATGGSIPGLPDGQAAAALG